MKRVVGLLAVGLFFFIPLFGFAWYPGQPLLPDALIEGAPYDIQACHVVQVVDNLLDFGVYISAFIVTIMFVYAGFLYVTASARPDNLNQAKNVFGMVALGFVIVLTAWLMVNIVLHVLTNQNIEFWTDIQCSAYRDVPRSSSGGPLSIETALMDNDLEAANRARLALMGVGVNRENACPPGQTTGCTTLAGTSPEVIAYAGQVKSSCGEQCEVTVTGGSEGGHAGGINPGSHGAGDKVDFRRSQGLQDWVADQEEAGKFTKVEDPTFGSAQWIDTETGAVWTDEGDHYDVCVSNCSAPASRGS